jgi:hypothetical protein
MFQRDQHALQRLVALQVRVDDSSNAAHRGSD